MGGSGGSLRIYAMGYRLGTEDCLFDCSILSGAIGLV